MNTAVWREELSDFIDRCPHQFEVIVNMEHVFTQVILRHFWVLLMLVTCLIGLVWWRRGQPHMRAKPPLKSGYRRLICGLLLFGNLPWVFMGAGIMFGDLPTVIHFLNPRNGLSVVLWYVTLIVWWLFGTYWIFFRRGAEILVEHPGLFNFPVNGKLIKIFFLLGLAAGFSAVLSVLF